MRTPALGHRRLSIVDLAAGAAADVQRGRHVWIVFNGEIYNHADAAPRARAPRASSIARGPTRRRIVHAYEQWGDDCVDAPPRHVRVRDLGCAGSGAAARARSPGRQAALLGARRRPLLFGSEIKAILASGLVRRGSNDAAHARSCSARGHSPASETMFAGIRKLMPGHMLRSTAAAFICRARTGTSRRRAGRADVRGRRRRRRAASSARCSRNRCGCG